MTKEDADFHWTEELEKCWQTLKSALKTAPVLVFPREECLKILITDASNRGVGGMLGQDMDGRVRPIGYFSKTLSKAESKWSTIERELFGIKVGIRKFHKFLIGQPFEVYTDHKPLLVLNKFKEIQNERLNRWGTELSSYSFVVKYIPGSENTVADTLSRLVRARDLETMSKENVQKYESHELTKALDKYGEEEEDIGECCALEEDNSFQDFINSVTPEAPELEEKNISAEQKSDNYCKAIRLLLERNDRKANRLKKRFVVIGDTLYRKKRKSAANPHILQTVIPSSLVKTLIHTFHESVEDGGHRGTEKVEKDIANKYWFENYREHIRTHVKECRVCNRIKPANHKPYGIPQVITAPTQPFEHLNADIMGPFQRSKRGNAYILTVVCRLTRFLYAKAIPNHTKETITKAFSEMFNMYSTPRRITTDRGTEFMSKDFQHFLRSLGVEHHPCASYYAAGDGLAEVNNRKIVQIIRSKANERSLDWDLFVGTSVKLINKSVNCITKYSPYYLVFGFNPSNAFERKFKIATLEEGTAEYNSIAEEEGYIERARVEARERTALAEEKWRKLRDNNFLDPPFDVKDLVWAIDRTQDPGVPQKLKPLKCGPWIITKKSGLSSFHIYPAVKMGGKDRQEKVVNSQMLFPYFGDTPAGYSDLCKSIDKGDLPKSRTDNTPQEIWTIENYEKWVQMNEESLKQRFSDRVLRSQTTLEVNREHPQSNDLQSQEDMCQPSGLSQTLTQYMESQTPLSELERGDLQNSQTINQNNSAQTSQPLLTQEELRQLFSESGSESSFQGFTSQDNSASQQLPTPENQLPVIIEDSHNGVVNQDLAENAQQIESQSQVQGVSDSQGVDTNNSSVRRSVRVRRPPIKLIAYQR